MVQDQMLEKSTWTTKRKDLYSTAHTYLPSCLVSALLDLLEKPAHPELLLLQGGGHQQHLLGRGRVVGNLAGGQTLVQTVLVKLHPTPCIVTQD